MVIQERSPVCGLTRAATHLHTRTGGRVIAICYWDGRLYTSHGGDELLMPGDVLINVGGHQQLLEVEKLGRPEAAAVMQKE